ncbi:hypothetical protein FORC13_p136 (plasmid) [Bacillus cereus]|nr:hypothetical protein FORC13_p136 [Bacillus cereus]
MGTESITRSGKKVEALNHPTLIAPIWEATDTKPVKRLAVYGPKI